MSNTQSKPAQEPAQGKRLEKRKVKGGTSFVHRFWAQRELWIMLIPGAFLITLLMCLTNIGNYLRRTASRKESNL
ncbi:MAG: hypothetical protein IJA00_04010 [Bacteroidaceae bacterium]|nr:hypothetical protein [Bacteroidaceae bacterium]